jgi:enterochelin esterase-like enzyme
LFNNKLISETSLAEMVKIENGEGLGINQLPYIRTVYGHPGGAPGFYSLVGYFPKDNVAFAICTNGLNEPALGSRHALLLNIRDKLTWFLGHNYRVANTVVLSIANHILNIYFDTKGDATTEVPALSWVTPAVSAPRVRQFTFDSKAVRSKVSYHIYTPEIYDMEPDRNFPVLYWLHGTGSGLLRIKLLATYFDAAIGKGKIPPMLIVFPYGMISSMWVDSKNGKVPMETVLIKELVPHIDANHRTFASRDGRLIEGFSMGGYGSARLGFKYHDIFGAVSILGAGPLRPELIETPRASQEQREALLQAVYGGDQEYFKAVSPWKQAEQNVTVLQNGSTTIRQVVGDCDETFKHNIEFHEHLNRLNIPHHFAILTGIPHDTYLYMDTLGEENWEFYRSVLD